jgi:structural maintenance of chromosome 1
VLNGHAAEARAKSGVALDEGKASEYEGLKADAAKSTAADRSQAESLNRQQKADENSLAQVEADHAELQTKLESDKERLQKLKERWASINAAAEDARAQAKEVERELQELQSKEAGDQTARAALETELEGVQAQLQGAKDDRQQSKQEEKMAECLETLMRLFPGVKGRLLDLCKPVQRKYDLAVSTAAGRHMDAIVVDTQQTGFECIQYLREHRVGVASFIPLGGLKTKDVNERLRTLGPKSKLVVDVIQCAAEIRPAVLYAVENTVVCETLDDARELCFRRNEKLKAVTLDGAVISKAGTMTGGNAPRDVGRSRWDVQAASELKAKRDKLLAEVGKLDTTRRDQGAATELQTKLTQLKSKEQYAVKDLKVTNEKMAGLQKQGAELKKQIAHVLQEKAKLQPSVSDRAALIEEVQARLVASEDKVFSAFSRSLGVANIREFEEGQLKILQETAEARRKLRAQRAKLEAQLEFERTKDFAGPLAKIQKRAAQAKARLAQAKSAAGALNASEAAVRERLRDAEEGREEAKSVLEEKEIEVKALQGERSECSKERVVLSKRVTAEETALEQLRGKLHTVLQKAKVDEVPLPIVGGGEMGGTEGRSETGSQAHSEAPSEATGSTHLSQKDDKAVAADRRDAERVDFKGLSPKYREAPSKQAEALKRELEKCIAELKVDIEAMQPNMKAAERFEDVASRHKTSADDFEAARGDARDATTLFNEVKGKRHDAFMACFNHVSHELAAIYRDLTKSSKHPLGGNAYLSLDDTEEPYLGGIKYVLIPTSVPKSTEIERACEVSALLSVPYQVQCHAAHEALPGHGAALGRRENRRRAGLPLCDPQLPARAVLRDGRGGRGAGQRECEEGVQLH